MVLPIRLLWLINCGVRRMKNKMMAGVIISIVLLSAGALYWYFSPSDVSIVNIDVFPKELLIGQLGQLTVFMQNNASNDVNVTLDVKNTFVDARGVSLKGVAISSYENLSYASNSSNATDTSQKEILLKPGGNSITYMVGYEVPGSQKVEVDIYQYGKIADSRTIEINVPAPKIKLNLWNNEVKNGTNEIYSIYGNLEFFGKGRTPGVVVNVTVTNELTNATVSTVTRTYSLDTPYDIYGSEPLVVWETRNSTSDPVTGAETTIETQTVAPVIVIELSKDKPSYEKYLMSPIVVKGKTGDRYKVVATARWQDQVVRSEVKIPG